MPPSTIGSAPIVGLSVAAAIPVAESIGATLDSAAGAITDEHIINRLKRPRPFYGPNIDPGTAFNASGSIDKGGVAEDAVSMKSVATTIKKRASPMRGGGAIVPQKRRGLLIPLLCLLSNQKTMRSSCKAISTLTLLLVIGSY